MLCSGFAGLGYQLVWTQQSAPWLGHEAAALLAVLTAFFGGIALGAWALGERIAGSRHPARWVAGCEIAIALWSLVLAWLMAPAANAMLVLTGAEPHPVWQSGVAFAGMLLLLLPATLAMGGTLPAMERLLQGSPHTGRALPWLYAANTAGAVLGVLATALWLLPAFGLHATAMVCAGLNLVCAALAMALARTSPANAPPAVQAAARGPQSKLLLMLFASGLLGIGCEVLVVRVLSQITENTVYTFAILLAVYLLGTAAGAAVHPSLARRWPDAQLRRAGLLQAAAAACLLGGCSLYGAECLRDGLHGLIGDGMDRALAVETLLAMAAFGPATLVMGALFSELATGCLAAGISLGRALAVNTLGAAAAPLLFGVLLAPAWGAKAGLLIVAAGYLAMVVFARRTGRPAWRSPAVLGLAAAMVAAALFLHPLVFVELPEGARIVSLQEGALATVSVVEDAQGVSRLRINNRQQEGSSSSLPADARQAWLPLLLHPAPQRVLFLGLGTGMTAGSAADDTSLHVDAVELLPEVITASAHFSGSASRPHAGLHLIAADARRHVRSAGPRYDLIVADNFHPARSGSAALYTVEHFSALRGRLQADGVVCQWLPLHQLDLQTLRSIVRSFTSVYPQAGAILASNSLATPVLGLVARADAGRFDLRALRQRLAATGMRGRIADYGIEDIFDVLGSWVAGPRELLAFAGDAPANTDDRPVVAYSAPRITYAAAELPQDRLLALLQAWSPDMATILDAGQHASKDTSEDPSGDALLARLAAYTQARKQYLAAGRGVRPAADPRVMLAQVREPLLAVLRTSPDFRPAREPLLRMAQVLAGSDPAAAQSLLLALDGLRPPTAATPGLAPERSAR